MTHLAARIRAQTDLAEEGRLAMFRIYSSYYEATSLELFLEDLAAKSHVIELYADGALRGFSTLSTIDFEFEGARNHAIFSGDTIIDEAYWGEQALVHAFCRFAGDLAAKIGHRRLFWMLISKGYRTYRYLSAFARDYYPHHSGPHHSEPAPDSLRLRMEHLARLKFQHHFDSESGLVRFPESRGQLRKPWLQIRGPLLEHPAVRFFLSRNPRYWAGEELVCLTELEPSNLRSFARRAFLEGLHAAEPYGTRAEG
jgi:hypothetical protein